MLLQSWHASCEACGWSSGGCERSATLPRPRARAFPLACGCAALATCGCGAAGPAKGGGKVGKA
eukprot:scaffold221099_cov19-Tisochrysis_lutea.AAC.1